MAKNGNKITTQQVYELVNTTRKELNDSIIRLETKFDTLEQGRLSHLESRLAGLEGRIIATTGAIAFVISTGIAVASIFIRK